MPGTILPVHVALMYSPLELQGWRAAQEWYVSLKTSRGSLSCGYGSVPSLPGDGPCHR